MPLRQGLVAWKGPHVVLKPSGVVREGQYGMRLRDRVIVMLYEHLPGQIRMGVSL
jgi:hypothetical protein